MKSPDPTEYAEIRNSTHSVLSSNDPKERCSQGGLPEGALLTVASGGASAALVQHVMACHACREELSAVVTRAASLRASLLRASCPPVDDLLALEAGLLPVLEQHVVRLHLKTCAVCQTECERLRIESLVEEPLRALWDRILQAGERIVQALLLPAPQPLLAVRGAEQQELHFRAAHYEIVLTVRSPSPPETRGRIEGQLSSAADSMDHEPIVVGLFDGTLPVRHDFVDEFGYFTLEGMDPGEYSLWVGLPNELMRVERIVVQ